MKRPVTDPAPATKVSSESDIGQLIERIGAGDARAMETFYTLSQSRIYRFARSRLNDSFAAADVLHETMIEVWKNAKRFEGRSQALTWVLGIANHKVLDQMRRQSRQPVAEPDETRPDTMTPALDVSIDLAQSGARLRQCLSQLTEKHRAVLHLAFYEDMAYGEIAAVVGCPEGTVKTRVFHAKEALKKCLMQKTG